MKKGFTLIELLVVVLIIGILAAVVLPQYQRAVGKARFSRFLPVMRAINDAQEIYRINNGEYSKDLGALDISLPAGAKTETATRADYENFSCFLGNSPVYDSVYCVDNSYEYPKLEKYFHRKAFLCWTGNTDYGKQICQALSGRSSPTGGGESGLGASYNF